MAHLMTLLDLAAEARVEEQATRANIVADLDDNLRLDVDGNPSVGPSIVADVDDPTPQ